MIKLGQRVRDAVTGFTGIATAKVEYINGCVQFAIQPETAADGKYPDPIYLDHQRLVFTGSSVEMPSSDTGGVMRDAPPAGYRG